MSDTPLNRRVDDSRINTLVDDMEIVKRTHVRTRQMADDILRMNGEQIKMLSTIADNSEKIGQLLRTTEQVRDILVTFRVTNSIAKWIAMIGAACAAIYYGWTHIK